MADGMHKVRVEERLKIKIGEAKNLPPRNHGAPCHRDTYCVLSLDQEEIFRTSTIERTLNPFFGEEFQFEVPRRFRYLSIYVFDRDKHLRQDKVLGKVAIKREDLHPYNNKDHWFALRPVDADSEVQGKVHIELTLEDSRKRLRVEPKPPDPDLTGHDIILSTRAKANNLSRLSEYCKESIPFGSCSSSTSKKLLSAARTEPSLALSRSESLKDRAQWPVRSKPPMHAMGGECTAPPAPPARTITECSELTTKNGQCDPFAFITLIYSNGRQVTARTKPRKKTVNPQFDDIFRFDLNIDADKDSAKSEGVACEARVSVWHDAAPPVFLGEVRLQLRQPAPPNLEAWYFLTSRMGGAMSRGATPPGTRLSSAGAATLGSLRLQLQYTIDHVFPLDHYVKFEQLLLRSVDQKPITSSAVYILGEIVSSKTDAAQPLVRLFTHHDLIVPIVKELADAEISALTDATTIFRGNTLVSKMMDEAMRLSGAAYLRAVLRPTLAAVLAERRPCEIDPARVKPSGAVAANLANLKDYVERVFGAITSSYASCPAVMCRLFDALRQCATRHFPRNAEVRYSVVSGFIFLRFFAPAILGPRLFDLTTEQIDPQTNRTLTLISKTIQSLGNLVSSRSAQQVCKEEYMAELYRSFCTDRHVQAIKQFLEIISSSSDTQNNNIQETPVLLKEGTMIKRSEGVRGTAGGTPRRRWTRVAHPHAKRRHFRLTSGELSWSRCGAKSGAHRLPLSGVIAVAPVEHPPPGAPLGANNIFQIVHRERVLFVQAGNCVERAEWVRLLTALCRRSPAHRGYYCDARWTCCGRIEADAEGCDKGTDGTGGVDAPEGGAARLGLRLDPARDLQRLHALLVAHSQQFDERLQHLHRSHDMTMRSQQEEAIAEIATLRELQDAMFDLEYRHRIHRRSLARETKYGSKQAPIGDDNYLRLAGATGNIESGALPWLSWRSDISPTIDLDGKMLPVQTSFDIGSSTESLKLSRHADERSSGKSNKSTGSGYLTMSCLKHEPSEDSDASTEKPARPPKPTRVIPATTATPPHPGAKPLCEYVDMEPRPPERRPRPGANYRCKEYELMANFRSCARLEDTPPAVPPRSHHSSNSTHKRSSSRIEETPPPPHNHRKPIVLDNDKLRSDEAEAGTYDSNCNVAPTSVEVTNGSFDKSPDGDRNPSQYIALDSVSNDDSLLDVVLKISEDETTQDTNSPKSQECTNQKTKEDDGIFSRVSFQRKSNPIKTHPNSYKPLKTSNSTSNVHDAGMNCSRPIAERLTPFFFKKKLKSSEESQTSKSTKKEDNLMGRLTPRFGQSRLHARGHSLELSTPPPAVETGITVGAADGARRIERSATTVSIPSRPINSSIVGNLKFFSLHRYGAQEHGAADAAGGAEHASDNKQQSLEYTRSGDTLAPRTLLAASTSDIRL
ncbi:GTPase-activating protein [Eumeta japonica]|uniref:GTPase-activating protein n=1 Tax=Eumeta variegata TaxID=151549 RepID=A0A4C1VSI1_EUMVA|nr:GTPase-activating protein [Eumeta japonica]